MEVEIRIFLKNKKKFELTVGPKNYSFIKSDLVDDNRKFLLIEDVLVINKDEILYIEIEKGKEV